MWFCYIKTKSSLKLRTRLCDFVCTILMHCVKCCLWFDRCIRVALQVSVLGLLAEGVARYLQSSVCFLLNIQMDHLSRCNKAFPYAVEL
jgi:hypothetical protein